MRDLLVAMTLSLLVIMVPARPATAGTPTVVPVPVVAVKVVRPWDMVSAKQHLFVSGNDEVRVLDERGRTRKRLKHLPGARGMVVSASGDRVYVAVHDAGLVVAIDTRRLKVVKRFPVGPCPAEVALAGGRLFFGTGDCWEAEPSIASIDPRRGGVPVPSGIPMVDDPMLLVGGGSTLVSASGTEPATLDAYRVTGTAVTREARIIEDGYVWDLAISPDGATVYVPHNGPWQVSAFPTSTLTGPVTYDTGSTARALAISRDGRQLAVTTGEATAPDLLVFATAATSPSFVGSTAWSGLGRPDVYGGTLTFSDDGTKLFELFGDVWGGPVLLASTTTRARRPS